VTGRLVAFALHQRFITLALALLLTAGGVVAFSRLPIEAYPDVVDVEVDVITIWPGHAAEEVERLVTIALEKELNGIAHVTFIRSFSIFGLSNIRVFFADGTDNYWSRQQVLERIGQAAIPADAKPQLGPLASAIGEVYRYTLESKTMPLVEVKALQDWTLEREFKKVSGVADIVSWGGGIKQYQITVDPARLRAYNLTLKQVFDAVAANNSNAKTSAAKPDDKDIIHSGTGEEKEKPASGKANVAGKVLYNEKPAANIEVKLCEKFNQYFGGCGGQTFTAKTDASGEYLITNVPPGLYEGLTAKVFDTPYYVFATSGFISSAKYQIDADQTFFAPDANLFKSDLQLVSPKAGAKLAAENIEVKWESYPDAAYYKFSIHPDSSSGAQTNYDYINKRVDGTSYVLEKPLAPGAYTCVVNAYNGNDVKLAESPRDIKFSVNDGGH